MLKTLFADAFTFLSYNHLNSWQALHTRHVQRGDVRAAPHCVCKLRFLLLCQTLTKMPPPW